MKLFDLFSYDSNFINNEGRTIAYKANSIAEFLCLLDETLIEYFDYNTAYYEELFLLCCIEAARLIKNNKDIKLYEKITDYAIKYSTNFDNIKNYNSIKTIIDNTFKQRSMFYMSLINTYNFNLNNDFFSDVFDYQLNIFALKWKNKTEYKEKIKSILEETLPALKEFYNSYF